MILLSVVKICHFLCQKGRRGLSQAGPFLLVIFAGAAFGKADFEGSIEMRAQTRPFVSDSKILSLLSHRFRLKGSFYPAQNLQTHFRLLSFSAWGQTGGQALRLQARGVYNITDELSLKLGHIAYEASPALISQNSYQPFPYVFSGAFLNYKTATVNLHVWGAFDPLQEKEEPALRAGGALRSLRQTGRINGGGAGGGFAGNKLFIEEGDAALSVGAAGEVHLDLEPLQKTHFHLVYSPDRGGGSGYLAQTGRTGPASGGAPGSAQHSIEPDSGKADGRSGGEERAGAEKAPASAAAQSAGRKNRRLQETARYGLSAQGEIGPTDYIVSFAGTGFQSDQAMLDIEAGLDLEAAFDGLPLHDSRLFVSWHRDTKNYDPWRYDRHEKAGLMDMFQWGNLTYGLVGFAFPLPKNFKARLQVLQFWQTEEGSFHPGSEGSLKFSAEEEGEAKAAALSKGKDLGAEADLLVTKKFSSFFQTDLLAGIFIPKKRLKPLLERRKDFISRIQFSALYKF